MKNNIKKVLLLIIIGISLMLVTSSSTYALTKETSYTRINDTQNLEVENLSFSNILFKNYSTTSTQAFGLTGTVNNNSNNTIDYTATVYYYDINYNLITQNSSFKIALSGTNDFNQMSNLGFLSHDDIDKIHYYRLLINTHTTTLKDNDTSPSKNSKYSTKSYVIDKYDININVNENNTLDITETITAYFNQPKHGIIRNIPLRNTIIRLDGTKSTNRTQITNVSVNKEYKISKTGKEYKLQIGSANHIITGEQTYIIKYTYNLGKDPMKNYDELYFNIIGNNWDTAIGNITFTITMPKDFDSSKLGFSAGDFGSTSNNKVKYTINERKISGSYSDILNEGQSLTVRCELPEGYFVGAGIPFNIVEYIPYILPIIFLIITILIWYKFGCNEKVIETIEFYPPSGLNSLDVGFIYNGKARTKDVTSLLIFLANKGYIQISNPKIELNAEKLNLSEDTKNNAAKKVIELQNKINEEKAVNPNSKKIKYYENMLDIYKNIDTPIDFKQYKLNASIEKRNKEKKFIIKKLKDYDGTNTYEKWFMEGLFSNNGTEVTNKMLSNSFYTTTYRILNNINSSTNIEKMFEKKGLKKTFIVLMIIATFCLITIPSLLNSNSITYIPLALISAGVGTSLLFTGIFKKNSLFSRIIKIFFGFVLGIIWINSILPLMKINTIYLTGYIIGIICVACMIACLSNFKKRTKYGNEMLGKLKGFKNFLETVEKEKLESLVMQNPNYFYDILPYTYVLDVSNKWIRKFESISLKAPDWYDYPDRIDLHSIERLLDSTMVSITRAMTSSPSSSSSSSNSSSSSSSSSGGGSSGGGSGGGGGSSW